MPLSEFHLIDRYFASRGYRRDDVALGIGDDAALLRVPPGHEVAVSIDTLVEGVHFPCETDAAAVGHKALAVGLSDLAAMGAEPAWVTLALTLPQPRRQWLQGFCEGFFGLAAEFRVELVGGDTTRGPLSVTTQLHGFVPPGEALRRAAARPGDLICVTGTLGDAGLALRLGKGEIAVDAAAAAFLKARLDRPRPRVAEALRLRGLARAAIDISDGLLADLGHILRAGRVGATLRLDSLPLSAAFRAGIRALDGSDGLDLALTAGDDYELCFTLAPGRRAEAEARLGELGTPCTCIGVVEAEPGLRAVQGDGTPCELPRQGGYDHFIR